MEMVKKFTHNDITYEVTIFNDPLTPLFKGNDIANIIEITSELFDE